MRRVRIKHVAQIRYGLGQPPPAVDEGVPILRATNIERGCINPNDLIFAAIETLPLDRAPLLEAGEVLVVRSGAYTGDSARVTPEWAGAAPGYDLRITPRSIESRFLAYQLLSGPVLDQIELVKGRAAQPHLNAEDLGDVRITSFSTHEERAIADFLDAETARLNTLIGALKGANLLLERRLEASIESIVWDRALAVAPLMRLTQDQRQIQYGIVLPGPDVDDGVPIVKGGNLLTGVLRAEGLAKTTREIEAAYSRSRLQMNDIAFAIRGAVGACALVPLQVEGANITQDVAMIAPRRDVDPTWLLYVMRSPSVQAQAEARILSATIRGINIRDLKRLKVPIIAASGQREQARELLRLQREHDSIVQARAHQIDLLLEHRQALITAAVSGRIEIPGVAA